MLSICGQTGFRGVHTLLDVPNSRPPKGRPRPPKTPAERRPRAAAPTFYLVEWREFFGYSFRKMQDLTGIDAASLSRAEDRAAGREDTIKNKNKGVDTGVLQAYADALDMNSIEPLRRRPEDPPSDLERFAEAPAEWRADIVRMLSRLPKE